MEGKIIKIFLFLKQNYYTLGISQRPLVPNVTGNLCDCLPDN